MTGPNNYVAVDDVEKLEGYIHHLQAQLKDERRRADEAEANAAQWHAMWLKARVDLIREQK